LAKYGLAGLNKNKITCMLEMFFENQKSLILVLKSKNQHADLESIKEFIRMQVGRKVSK